VLNYPTALTVHARNVNEVQSTLKCSTWPFPVVVLDVERQLVVFSSQGVVHSQMTLFDERWEREMTTSMFAAWHRVVNTGTGMCFVCGWRGNRYYEKRYWDITRPVMGTITSVDLSGNWKIGP